MTRIYGPNPDPARRYTPRHGAYGVLEREGLVLLTLQEEPQMEFQLPGGGIDPGESPLRALHREVMEETGWRIAAPRRLGAFRRFTYMPEYDLWAEKICHIYAARPILRHGPPSEPGHHAVWMAPETAYDLLGNRGDAAFLKSALRVR
ncbi:8-oxo-dGTP diphosphatase [Palleronia aestuarii]|uniref:8-oxo-dGTP diphosphatase n=1 Tax=Palleronia aestuarii TaxID=568105 RepID=A0A2W7P6C0_9RHOB|nr:NUDIX hydrolase [Palleronia aestuarii]PZX18952.1 8-oxo-dGTP diphosphatase [Palleronia aestuarii]